MIVLMRKAVAVLGLVLLACIFVAFFAAPFALLGADFLSAFLWVWGLIGSFIELTAAGFLCAFLFHWCNKTLFGDGRGPFE